MLVILFVVDNRVDDVISFHLRSGDETGRQLNREVWTGVILIFPSRDVAGHFADAIVAKLLNNRRSRVLCNFSCPVRSGDFGFVLLALRNAPSESFCLMGLSKYIFGSLFFL